MNRLWKYSLAALAATTLVALTGCSSTPEATPKVEDRTVTASPVEPSAGSGASTSGVGSSGSSIATVTAGAATGLGNSALRDPKSPLSRREIFYDYDSFIVKDEYKPLLEAHSAYLKANRSMRIKIEGNTDERGSREYNLALGQKRSESVKRVLMLLGVSESQIDTVSFGEEKPRNPASNEAAYAENRRCDLAYAGE